MLHTASGQDGAKLITPGVGTASWGALLKEMQREEYWGAHESLALPGGKQPTPVRRMMGRGMD